MNKLLNCLYKKINTNQFNIIHKKITFEYIS